MSYLGTIKNKQYVAAIKNKNINISALEIEMNYSYINKKDQLYQFINENIEKEFDASKPYTKITVRYQSYDNRYKQYTVYLNVTGDLESLINQATYYNNPYYEKELYEKEALNGNTTGNLSWEDLNYNVVINETASENNMM